jgi:hypothetical protein
MPIQVFDELPPLPGEEKKRKGIEVFDTLPEFVKADPLTQFQGPLERVGSAARSFISGVPFVGEFADEARSKIRSAIPGGSSYEEAQARERASRQQFETENPVASTVLPIAGGVAGTVATLPALGGAGVIGATGRTAMGVGARTLPGNVGRGAAAGLAQGIASGAGAADADGFWGRVRGGAEGGAIGAAAGGILPLAFAGGHHAINSGWQRLTGQEDALSRLSGAARRYVENISTPQNLDLMEEGFRRLGPEAMPADVSPEWQGVAQGVAARPGSREEVINPLTQRAARGGEEVRASMNREFGPAIPPSDIEADLAAQRRVVGPQYDAAMANATAVPTRDIADILDAGVINYRGDAQKALRAARRDLTLVGTDELDPNPATVHQIRQSIDGQMNKALRAGDTNVASALEDIRNRIDERLRQNVPGLKDIDARYAELKGQETALARGRTLLETQDPVWPVELAQEMAQNAQPGRLPAVPAANLRLRQGQRGKLEEVVGSSRNDVQAIRRYVKGTEAEGDWNPEKLGLLFGRDRAGRFLDEVERRHAFQQTANQVIGGSPTAGRQAFMRALDALESPVTGPGANMPTLYGTAANAMGKLTTMMTGAIGAQRAQRFASELGRIAVSQPPDRDEFVALMRRAGMNRAQIERAYRLAAQGGLVVGRHAASSATEAEQ